MKNLVKLKLNLLRIISRSFFMLLRDLIALNFHFHKFTFVAPFRSLAFMLSINQFHTWLRHQFLCEFERVREGRKKKINFRLDLFVFASFFLLAQEHRHHAEIITLAYCYD